MELSDRAGYPAEPDVQLPQEVLQLLPRERELATIVYARRAATANEIIASLSSPLTNSSVRSMLTRLVRKGVLKRTLWDRTYIYSPALSYSASRDLALKRFARDYFAGSLPLAAATLKELVRVGRPRRRN